MKSYILLYVEYITYKCKVYIYLWRLLHCYMRVLSIIRKYSEHEPFREMIIGELHVTDVSAVKSDDSVL